MSASLDRTSRVWDLSGVMRPPPLGAIVCIATMSTASVPRAHEAGVAFAAMPQPNLLVSASVDGALKLFQLTGTGVGDPSGAEAYVDVLDVGTLRPPRQPELAARAATAPELPFPAEGTEINDLPLPLLDRDSGLYRGAGLVHFGGESAVQAVLFSNDGVTYISTIESVPDEDDGELTPVIEPVCFTVIGGPGAAALAPIDADIGQTSGKAAVAAPPPAYAPVAMVHTHPHQPIFAVVHEDGLLRVMRITPVFNSLTLVQRSTEHLREQKTWLATISRQPTAKTIAAAFAGIYLTQYLLFLFV